LDRASSSLRRARAPPRLPIDYHLIGDGGTYLFFTAMTGISTATGRHAEFPQGFSNPVVDARHAEHGLQAGFTYGSGHGQIRPA
jgi:hypothetical protein